MSIANMFPGVLSPEMIAALKGRRRVRNRYGGTVRRDPNYTPPAEVDATAGANASSRLAMNNHILTTGRRFESLGNLNTRRNNRTSISSLVPAKKFKDPISVEPYEDISSELTNVPPEPSSLIQPFAQPAQQSANQIFGDLFARQNAVGAPMMFKINK